MISIMRTIIFFLFVLSACSETLLRTSVEKPDRASSFPENEELCDSWRLSVETNNAGPWEKIPEVCVPNVISYVKGDTYYLDSKVVAMESLKFANTVEIAGDGKDVWIFDIDDTLVSSVIYITLHGRRPTAEEYPLSPPLPASVWLYNIFLDRGFKIVLLTGRNESLRELTETNLLFAGYNSWDRLIMRGESDADKTATVYKSEKRAELVAEGYKIHGSSGDQWSDLLGSPVATRSFKLPNPMYYIP
ncbi:acid phosphatase 1-like [Iris pallida]|uniref:Acid phosphatase 1-like n=1 Tax=Iris pallida TaxID=29817 RepID=A0AAX6HDU6_IRIPA|nr:acid phosphatase 1-like [Iris pallida]KAJ6838922.1 acid phosphatase 1-like [Iris pallida]